MKTIFLAYPFALPQIREAVEAGCSGIATLIAADLSLFDLTGWNPNVAAEFGTLV